VLTRAAGTATPAADGDPMGSSGVRRDTRLLIKE
jgi:hypothetical protein